MASINDQMISARQQNEYGMILAIFKVILVNKKIMKREKKTEIFDVTVIVFLCIIFYFDY